VVALVTFVSLPDEKTLEKVNQPKFSQHPFPCKDFLHQKCEPPTGLAFTLFKGFKHSLDLNYFQLALQLTNATHQHYLHQFQGAY